MTSFQNITDQQLNAFKSSLASGQYNLLLGSGVSLDSYNAIGHLPPTDQLRRELCTAKGAHPNTTLQRIFQLLSVGEVESFVTSRFQNCTAGPSVAQIPCFIWRRIFSFNIDDAIEDAYRSQTSMQSLKSS